MALPVDYETNWDEITKRKQKRTNESNDRESKKRIGHTFEVGGKVLLSRPGIKLRKLSQPRKGPYRILKVNGNGSLKIQLRPCVTDVVNTRRVHPFFEKWPSTFCKLGSKATMEAGAVMLPCLGIPLMESPRCAPPNKGTSPLCLIILDALYYSSLVSIA